VIYFQLSDNEHLSINQYYVGLLRPWRQWWWWWRHRAFDNNTTLPFKLVRWIWL